MARHGDGMSHPSLDTQPTAAAGLRVSRHPRRELLRPHRRANRLSQALQTSSQALLQVPVWPKGLLGDSLPVLGSNTSSQAAGPWESRTRPGDNTPGGYSQMLLGSPGRQGRPSSFPMPSARGTGRREPPGSSGLDTMCGICRSNTRAGWKRNLKSRLLGCLGCVDPSLDLFRAQARRKQLFLIFSHD